MDKDLNYMAKKMKQLEDVGELRISYSSDIPDGICMYNSDQFALVLNPNQCWEQQIKIMLHEMKHICSHLNNDEYSGNVDLAEKEANEFMNTSINSYMSIIKNLRG